MILIQISAGRKKRAEAAYGALKEMLQKKTKTPTVSLTNNSHIQITPDMKVTEIVMEFYFCLNNQV